MYAVEILTLQIYMYIFCCCLEIVHDAYLPGTIVVQTVLFEMLRENFQALWVCFLCMLIILCVFIPISMYMCLKYAYGVFTLNVLLTMFMIMFSFLCFRWVTVKQLQQSSWVIAFFLKSFSFSLCQLYKSQENWFHIPFITTKFDL